MIFLTGGSGFLGKKIISKLLEKDIKIRSIFRKSIPNLQSGIEWIELDLLDLNFPDKFLEECLCVIHCAGSINGNKDVLDKINFFSTKMLIEASKKNNIDKFIYVSSIDVLLSNTAYAESKRKAELEIINSGIRWIIIRPSQIFGYDDTKNFAVLNYIVKTFPCIPLPFAGEFNWEPVYVNDLATLIVEFAVHKNVTNKIVNVVGPEIISFKKIIEIFERHNNVKRLKINISKKIIYTLFMLLKFIKGKIFAEKYLSSFGNKVVPNKPNEEKIILKTNLETIFRNNL